MSQQQALINALLQQYGRTFAAELSIDLQDNTPAPLFRLLCLTLLTSAPVQADIAMQGAQALGEAGWTTPKKLQDSSWQDRVTTLNKSGYARVDEKTATQLADLNETLLTKYDGDLRQLRTQADGSVQQAQQLMQEFKGIGPTGASIFLREVQAAWPEFYPFADKAALKAAEQLGLPDDANKLAQYTDAQQFPELVAALVRVQLDKNFDGVIQAAQ